MTLQELSNLLTNMIESGTDPETTVHLAIQPNYPFAHYIGDVVEAEEEDGKKVVYIGEAGQQGYLSSEACGALGWR